MDPYEFPPLPAPVPVAQPADAYTFTLTPDEEAELATTPLVDQAEWIKALAAKKRPAKLPSSPV